MGKDSNPKCRQLDLKDCYFRTIACCDILQNTEFDRPCPFYKTTKQAKADAKKYPKKI